MFASAQQKSPGGDRLANTLVQSQDTQGKGLGERVFLEQIIVKNVRNLEEMELRFTPGLNFLTGPNGSGKTSILEAVSLLCRGQSFRTPNIRTVIRHGEAELGVWGQVGDEVRGTMRVAFSKNRLNETEVKINGALVRRASELVETMPIQVITADSAEIVLGPPKARRRYLDWGLVHERSGYLTWRREYQRVLRQRNTCLRSGPGKEQDRLLDAWDDRLAEVGQRIAQDQADYLEAIRIRLADILFALGETGDAPVPVSLDYHPGWCEEGEDLLSVIRSTRERDVKLGRTLAGPHAADIRIQVGQHSAARVLSRGEAKSLVQALNVAQADQLQRSKGRSSLFLVDELAAELDERRRLNFLDLLGIRQYQVLAASAVPLGELGQRDARLGKYRLFHVEQGQARQSLDNE